ncbi:hypothetical protein CSKR_110458 [Clonorchis sinensis]|uniref:Uncharacterized protein n=1 Tax=Clonorchis sinensis TaxID=79923 RepID=A0A3R7G150_CLOSI|nr:hypothetical protein CSKR_110458 [Clonorchis sinensis]
MPSEGSTRAEILPGCPTLERGNREAEVGFELQTFRSVNSRSNHLGHLALDPLMCRLMFQLPRYSRHCNTLYRRNTLLMSLMKTIRQSTIGFALLRAHRVEPPERQNEVGAGFIYGTINVRHKFINYTNLDSRYSSKTNGTTLGLQKYEPKEQTGSHVRQSPVH